MARAGQKSSRAMGWLGGGVLAVMVLGCLATLPYTLGKSPTAQGQAAIFSRRYEAGNFDHALLPPFWTTHRTDEQQRLDSAREKDGVAPRSILGTDRFGRSLFIRCLTGGGISLGIGLAAAAIAVVIGTIYGTTAAYLGGRVDATMMRIVDVLFGLPYILLVVLLAVATDGLLQRVGGDLSPALGQLINVITLLVAIGGISWLTMARVIRGQVLSLKQQPFMEASRAIGAPLRRQFVSHLLPNLMGPIIVYATLTVPAAILSESFLSFLGIGVKEPLPSWGNLAADGLNELNIVRVRWWLLLWPCLFIAVTLVSLNFLGERLRESFDPKWRSRA